MAKARKFVTAAVLVDAAFVAQLEQLCDSTFENWLALSGLLDSIKATQGEDCSDVPSYPVAPVGRHQHGH